MAIVSWCGGEIGKINSMLSEKVSTKDLANKIIKTSVALKEVTQKPLVI